MSNINCPSLKNNLATLKALENGVVELLQVPSHKDVKIEYINDKLEELTNAILTFDALLFDRKIIRQEAVALEKFFGNKIKVLHVPATVTPEQYMEWQELGMELHYLPDVDMSKDVGCPGWQNKLDKSFYDLVADGTLPANSTRLKAGWILIEGIKKSRDGYVDDLLGDVLAYLRSIFAIKSIDKGGSRFNITARELKSQSILNELAYVINVPVESLGLPRAIEYSVLGNMHHPEWGDTECNEWLADSQLIVKNLVAGWVGDNNLSSVGLTGFERSSDNTGFRLMARLNENK
ncbi:MAG: hypothetical protein WCG01_02230 [bacterium]